MKEDFHRETERCGLRLRRPGVESLQGLVFAANCGRSSEKPCDQASTTTGRASTELHANSVAPGTSHSEKPASVLPIAVAASTSLG